MVTSLAPFVPTRLEVVKRMLETSKTGFNDVVFDLGCVDGRIILSSVRDFGARKAVGYEMRHDLYTQACEEIAKQNLSARVIAINDDLMNAPLSEATVITLYLTTSGNEWLKPKIRNEANTGTRLVSHDFEFKGWQPSIKEDFLGHRIYLYIVPTAFSHLKT